MRKILIILGMMMMVPVTFSDPTIDDWYDVEDWEIEVCSKYGGTAEAQTGVTAKAQGDAYMYQTTVTLQGQKSKSGDSYIYETAWYFRPMNEDQEYSIELIGPGVSKEIYKNAATKELGDSNYHAEESNVQYDSVKIIYETGTLTVPIVTE